MPADDSDHPDWCCGLQSEPNQQFLVIIPTVFLVLGIIFTVLLKVRTNTILKSIQYQHLKYLPSKNALTFIDTQILFLSTVIQFLVLSVISSLFYFLFISHGQFIILKAILHFLIHNVFICFIFPLYIILKTKKYFPRMWDDNSQILKQNNDFFAENPSQVNPQP